MPAIRPVLLLAALALVNVAQADLNCYACEPNGDCPLNAPMGRTKKCPKDTKYCIVEAGFKSTANTLPGTTVRTGASSTARPAVTSTARAGGPSTARPGPSTVKPGEQPVYYTRKCGRAGMTKPAGYKKEGDLYCLESKYKKECYCKEDNCNKKNPSKMKGDAASTAAKLSMVVAMGILAYVL